MIKDKKNLYRTGYFESQKMDGEGRILLKVSFNQNVYLCLSVILLLLVIIFVSFSEYTRRETLVGIVSPLGGTVKVQANDSGYVKKLFVKEGDKIEASAPLYEIKTERFDESGTGVKQRILVSIESQYQLLLERRQQELEKADLERKALIEDIARLDSEIHILKNVLKFSNQELLLTRQLVDKQKSLLKNNYLSELEYQKQQLELLSKQTQFENSHLNLKRLLREKENQATRLVNLDIDLAIALKELDRQLEEKKQSKAEFLYQSDSLVVSPIKGIVASILVDEGHAVTNAQPLLIIVPESEQAFVELYAPSRSIGFIEVGQTVRLRFDAFPYEKFGVQTGVVCCVSKSAVAPEMIANSNLIKKKKLEGIYQVKVELTKPTITVYGHEEHLVTGMTVVADVELDTRHVYEWILEPLYTIKGKI